MKRGGDSITLPNERIHYGKNFSSHRPMRPTVATKQGYKSPVSSELTN